MPLNPDQGSSLRKRDEASLTVELFPDHPHRVDYLVGKVAAIFDTAFSSMSPEQLQGVVKSIVSGHLRSNVLSLLPPELVHIIRPPQDDSDKRRYGGGIIYLAIAQPQVLRHLKTELNERILQSRDNFASFFVMYRDFGLLVPIIEPETTTIPRSLFNPVTSWFVELSSKFPESFFSEWQRSQIFFGYSLMSGYEDDEKISILMKLYGKFARRNDETPVQFSERIYRYSQTLRTFRYNRYFEEELHIAEQFETGKKDSPRLKEVKKFWKDVFITYWTALSQQEDRRPHELTPEDSEYASKRLPPQLGIDKKLDAAIASSNYATWRKKLHRSCVNIVSKYTIDTPNPETINALFSHEHIVRVCSVLSGYLSAHTEKQLRDPAKLQELSNLLQRVVMGKNPDILRRFFGNTFENLSSVEQISLIFYLSFTGNGSMTRGIESGVSAFQQKILPLLEKYHDTPIKNVVFPAATFEEIQQWGMLHPFSEEDQDSPTAEKNLYEVEKTYDIFSTTEQSIIRRLQKVLPHIKDVIRQLKSVGWNDASSVSKILCAGIGILGTLTSFLYEVDSTYVGNSVFILRMMSLFILLVFVNDHVSELEMNEFVPHLRKYTERLSDILLYSEGQIEDLVKTMSAKKKMSRRILLGGLSVSLALSAFFSLHGISDFFSSLAPHGQKNESDMPIKNDGHAPELGEPTFYYYEQPQSNPLFWIDGVCTQGPTRPDVQCLTDSETTYIDRMKELSMRNFSDKTSLQKTIQDYAKKGYIVRTDLATPDRFGIPVGFAPHEVLVLGDSSTSFWEWNVGTGVQKYDTFGNLGGSSAYVVYEPTGDSTRIGSKTEVQYSLINQVPLISESKFQRPELAEIYPIYQWAQQAILMGVSEKGVLDGIYSRLQEAGYSYGFEDINTNGGKTPFDKLAELVRHKKWICNNSSYAVYVIAQSAGLKDVVLIKGYLSEKAGYAGYDPSRRHAIVAYYDTEIQSYAAYDSTLPPLGSLDYPSLPEDKTDVLSAQIAQDSEKENFVQLGLLAGQFLLIAGTVTAIRQGVGCVVQRNSKALAQRTEKEFKEFNTEMNSLSPEVIDGCYHLLFSLAEFYENVGRSKELGWTDENGDILLHGGFFATPQELAGSLALDLISCLEMDQKSQKKGFTKPQQEFVTHITKDHRAYKKLNKKRQKTHQEMGLMQFTLRKYSKYFTPERIPKIMDGLKIAIETIVLEKASEQFSETQNTKIDQLVKILRILLRSCQ